MCTGTRGACAGPGKAWKPPVPWAGHAFWGLSLEPSVLPKSRFLWQVCPGQTPTAHPPTPTTILGSCQVCHTR